MSCAQTAVACEALVSKVPEWAVDMLIQVQLAGVQAVQGFKQLATTALSS